MGADDKKTAGDAEKKPVTKQEKRSESGRHSRRCYHEVVAKGPKDKKFEGSCPDLLGHVFTVNTNRSTQVAKYTAVFEQIIVSTREGENRLSHQQDEQLPKDTSGLYCAPEGI